MSRAQFKKDSKHYIAHLSINITSSGLIIILDDSIWTLYFQPPDSHTIRLIQNKTII